MNIFFADLDNTLVYSHRKVTGSNIVLAEYLNGREQSYMPEMLYNFLKSNRFYKTVPVTARTSIQFQRIFLLKELECNRALVCNGGVLLDNGVENREWKEKTMDISGDQQSEVARAYEILTDILPAERIHYVEPFFLYAVVKTEIVNDEQANSQIFMRPENIRDYLNALLDRKLVEVYSDGRKVYTICKTINKGLAVKRYKELNRTDISVAAGDSLSDVSMFDEVDYGISLGKLRGKCRNKNMVFTSQKLFPETICNRLLEIKDKEDKQIDK